MSSKKTIRKKEKLNCYHESIHEFFDSFPLSHARIYLLSACKAAESHNVWNKKPPLDLLFFFESLESLLFAVFAIEKCNKTYSKASVPKPTGTPNLDQHELYCASTDGSSAWDCFPRSLSDKEYANPYRVLQKITRWATKKEWKGILRDILHYALGSTSLSDLGVNLEMVAISEDLEKMMDACHLIHVRSKIKKTIFEPKN